jgi:phage tail-like protein
VNWKDLWNNAFPAKQPSKSYQWPKMTKPGPAGASSYPQLQKPGAGEGGKWPTIPKPGAGEGGQYPAMAPVGAGEGSNFPDVAPDTKNPGSSLPSQRGDHVGDFNFRIEIEGMSVGGFAKVEGLNVGIDVIEYQHGNDITPRKRMGRIKVENVRLIKGYINDASLYKWCESAMKGDVARKSMSIVLLDDSRAIDLARYNLYEVWPTRWTGFKFDAKGRGALVEEIELVVEQIELV